MATAKDDDILEGFLCPICKADLKSASQLTSHFESQHQEEQDVLKSLKDIFGKAKKIILNNNDSDLLETFHKTLKFNYQEQSYDNEEHTVGVSRSSGDYFKAVRSARLERFATETNKLLIRLDKLVCNMPSEPNQRKLHEQIVGISVSILLYQMKEFNFTICMLQSSTAYSYCCRQCRFLLLSEILY